MRASGGRCASWGCGIKKGTIFATEQDRPDVAVAREVWRAAQAELDFTSLVFVDETGTTTSMTRLRGWDLKGKPLLGKAPHGHWMTSTFVAGLRHDGIAAPMLIDTPMTGRIFQQCLTNHLIPELLPGSIVVCDNLAAHKIDGIRQCLENVGMGLLYLPPPAFAGAGSTALTSIPSSRPSPRSRRCSATMRPAPSTPSSQPSSASLNASSPPNVQTTSASQAMCKCDRIRL